MKKLKPDSRQFYKRDVSPLIFGFGFLFIFISIFVYTVWLVPQPVDVLDPSNLTDLAQLMGAEVGLLTLVYAVWNFRNEHLWKKKMRSSWYIQKWYGYETDESVDCFKELSECLAKESTKQGSFNAYKKSRTAYEKNHPGKTSLRRKLNDILNFFEHMGQDVKLGIADEVFLRDFFFYIVINNYDSFRLLIDYYREQHRAPELYCNFEALAKYWLTKNQPSIPRIIENRWPNELEWSREL